MDIRCAARCWHTRPVTSPDLARVRAIALALPEVTERRSHGEPCFFVRDRRPLCYFHDNHNGDGRISIWCPAPPGVQDELVYQDPRRFFRPSPSSGGVFATWVGVYLDGTSADDPDWLQIAEILEDAFRHVAPKVLVQRLDGH